MGVKRLPRLHYKSLCGAGGSATMTESYTHEKCLHTGNINAIELTTIVSRNASDTYHEDLS